MTQPRTLSFSRLRPARPAAVVGLAVLLPALLGGCAVFDRIGSRSSAEPDLAYSARAAGQRADVNSAGRLGDIEIPVVETPSLDQMMDRVPVKKGPEEKEGDRLRMPAMRDAALAYGARGGLAWTSRGINEQLRSRSAELTRTYDFNRILIHTPSQATLLPPVISEASETWESSDAGKTLRVADKVYEIVEQARFAPVAPLWHSYLIRSYTAPEPPPDSLLPKNEGERDAWKKYVAEGWEAGATQAREIFNADLRRLERDFVGMVRYKALLEEGKVSPPVVAEAKLGVTGTGQDMRVNDRAYRITRDPTLNTPTSSWRASPSPRNEEQAGGDRTTSQTEVPSARDPRWRRY